MLIVQVITSTIMNAVTEDMVSGLIQYITSKSTIVCIILKPIQVSQELQLELQLARMAGNKSIYMVSYDDLA